MLDFRAFGTPPNYAQDANTRYTLTVKDSSFVPLFMFNGHSMLQGGVWNLPLYDAYLSKAVYRHATRAFDPTQTSGYLNGLYMILQGKTYYITKGAIFEVVNGERNTFSGRHSLDIILRPLLVIGFEPGEHEYMRTCMAMYGRTPETNAFKVLMHPVFDIPKTSWKGARSFWRRIKSEYEGAEKLLAAPENLMIPPKIPTFASLEQREETLRRVGVSVFHQ